MVSKKIIALAQILILFLSSALYGVYTKKNELNRPKVVYMTNGNWGNIFDRKAKEKMRQAGYDLEPMYRLQEAASEAGYELRLAKRDENHLVEINGKRAVDFVCLIAFDVYPNQLQFLKKYPMNKLILFLWEPPSVSPNGYKAKNHEIFSKVYTWKDDLIDHEKYFKLHYPVLHLLQDNPIPFSERRLAALVSSNRVSKHPNELYSERASVVDYFEKNAPDDFDLYGKYWDKKLETYQGLVESKFEVLQNHKFYFCYENMMGIEGYITEKIFDCFEAGCVPIYWGASNITDYIPQECFINRESFSSNEELHSFLESMDESAYSTYIDNIKRFLASEQAQKFSADNFVDTVMALIKSCDVD